MADATTPAIAAIEARLRRDPDDAESWRVYADHLLDQGDRRGELITLTTLLQSRRHDGALAQSIRALDEALRSESPDLQRCTWKYGFPIRLAFHVDTPRAITSLGALLAQPRMRLCGSLHLSFHPNLRARFYEGFAKLELGSLAQIFAMRTRRGNALARALAANPTLRLAALHLDDTQLGDPGMLALARSTSLPGLTTLSLRHGTFGEKGLAALLDSPLAETLEVLDLHDNEIDEASARLLATAHLGRLRSLGLHVHQFRPREAIRTLAASRTLPPDIVRFWRGLAG